MEDAEKLRKASQADAIKAWLADATDNLTSDPDAARERIEAVLVLDPDSSEAKSTWPRS